MEVVLGQAHTSTRILHDPPLERCGFRAVLVVTNNLGLIVQDHNPRSCMAKPTVTSPTRNIFTVSWQPTKLVHTDADNLE